MRSRAVPFASLLALLALLAAGAPPANAQTLSVVGKAGAYLPVNGAHRIPAVFETLVVTKEPDVAFGGAVELSPLFWPVDLRVGADYLTGMNVSTEGMSGEVAASDGSLLMLSGDLVWRPLPRLIIVQPYLLGGVGYKRESYRLEDGASYALPDDQSDYLLHAGVGADIALGGVDLVVEASDYIGRTDPGAATSWSHDVFASVGLRLGLF